MGTEEQKITFTYVDNGLYACSECGAFVGKSTNEWRMLHIRWHEELDAQIIREATYAAKHTLPATY